MITVNLYYVHTYVWCVYVYCDCISDFYSYNYCYNNCTNPHAWIYHVYLVKRRGYLDIQLGLNLCYQWSTSEIVCYSKKYYKLMEWYRWLANFVYCKIYIISNTLTVYRAPNKECKILGQMTKYSDKCLAISKIMWPFYGDSVKWKMTNYFNMIMEMANFGVIANYCF